MNLNKLFESNDIRKTLLEYDVSAFPEEKLALDTIMKYHPDELDKEIFDYYVQEGILTADGKWDEAKLGDFYRNSPDDLVALYDIVSETRYVNSSIPTPYDRVEEPSGDMSHIGND